MNILTRIDRKIKSGSRCQQFYCQMRNRIAGNHIYDYSNNNRIIGNGYYLNNVTIRCFGNRNQIIIGSCSDISNLEVTIQGDDNVLTIGERCHLGKGHIWFSQSESRIEIGHDTSITDADFAVTETGTSIIVGRDCLFAWGIDIRSGDGHPIIDIASGHRINPAKSITIGNHVWIASNVQILKGVSIGNDTVVGARSVVTKGIPSNCLAAGSPAKVIKTGITWLKENDNRDTFDASSFQSEEPPARLAYM